MFLVRRVQAGSPDKVYQIVRNIMPVSAAPGRVLLFATQPWFSHTTEHGIAATYATSEGERNLRGYIAGVVESTPIPPGECGAVVCHGFVRSVLVHGFGGLGYSSAQWRNMVFYPTEWESTQVSWGALSMSLYIGGFAGTNPPASVLGGKWFVAGTFVGVPATESLGWLPMYIRLL